MTTYITDHRWSPGASGATVPDDAVAVYSARWIDQGDGYPADIVYDRQGFAYNDHADLEQLIARLTAEGPGLRKPQPVRDTSIPVVDTPTFKVVQRRTGGYVYVDAWLINEQKETNDQNL